MRPNAKILRHFVANFAQSRDESISKIDQHSTSMSRPIQGVTTKLTPNSVLSLFPIIPISPGFLGREQRVVHSSTVRPTRTDDIHMV